MRKLDTINNRTKNNCAKLLFSSFQSIIYTDWKKIVLREQRLKFKINTYYFVFDEFKRLLLCQFFWTP